MTSFGAPKAASALALAAAALLLAGCGAGGGAAKAAAATAAAPAAAADTAAAPAAENIAPTTSPATKAPTTSPSSRPRVTHAVPRRSAAAARVTRPAPTATPTRTRRPAPSPAPSTSPAPTGLTSSEAQVLALVNKERASAGCRPLTSNATLVAVARAHSRDMGVHHYFDHNSLNGASPFDRMRAAGYRGGLMGENIAAGQPTAAAVMDAWMHSPGHRANILNCGYKVIGIGVATVSGSPYRIYWTQDFGDR